MVGSPGKRKEVPFRYRGKLISAIAFFQQFKSFIICRREKLYRCSSASARYRKFMSISISSKVATTTKYRLKNLNFSSSIFNLGHYKREKTTMTCFYVYIETREAIHHPIEASYKPNSWSVCWLFRVFVLYWYFFCCLSSEIFCLKASRNVRKYFHCVSINTGVWISMLFLSSSHSGLNKSVNTVNESALNESA